LQDHLLLFPCRHLKLCLLATAESPLAETSDVVTAAEAAMAAPVGAAQGRH